MAAPLADELRRTLVAAAPAVARFGFQGLRSTDAITVEGLLPLSFLIACDWGLDGPEWDRKLRYFSVERGQGRRIVWTHSSLVEAYGGLLGASLRDYLTQGDTPSLLVPYRTTEFLSRLSGECGGRLSILANPLDLKTRLDDKIAFREEAQRRKIAVPPGEVVEIGALEAGLFGRWGPRLILTERIGSSGNQTHLAETAGDLGRLKAALAEKHGAGAGIIVNRYLDGPAVGAAALVYGGRARMSHPSVMLTGLPGCSMHRFDYAGSDYGAYALLPRSAQEQIEGATQAFGEWVAAAGYQGVFGVDFIVNDGTAYALELNPRLLGTTQLMTELEMRDASCPPSIFWHLAEFLGVRREEAGIAPALREMARPRLRGFQLLLRNTRQVSFRVGNALPPGIYEMKPAGPVFLRKGTRIRDLEGPEEVLLTCAPPESGTLVLPRGVLFKLEGVGSVYGGGEEQIRPEGAAMIAAFTRALDLRESD